MFWGKDFVQNTQKIAMEVSKIFFSNWIKNILDGMKNSSRNLSDCHYVDEINYLLNAFRWQKKKI